MAQHPALFGGLMLGAAVWLEVWAIWFLAGTDKWYIAVIPGLFFVAGIFLAGAVDEGGHAPELAVGGICVAVALGFVVWFWVISNLMIASAVSLGSGILILLGLVFIAGGTKRGY